MKTLTNNFRLATVIAVTRDNTKPAYDVRTNEGDFYRGVPIAMYGRSHFPVKQGDIVHLIFPKGAYDLPYIVSSDPTSIAEKTDSAGNEADYFFDQTDLTLRHENQSISLSSSGITLNGTTTRIQIGDANKLRISKNNVSENAVLNADPFINELYSYIAELETSLTSINAFLQSAMPALIALLPDPTAQTTLLATLATIQIPSASVISKTNAQQTANDSISIP